MPLSFHVLIVDIGSGGLTLLMTDEIGGLQILDGKSWIEVPPCPGAYVSTPSYTP